MQRALTKSQLDALLDMRDALSQVRSSHSGIVEVEDDTPAQFELVLRFNTLADARAAHTHVSRWQNGGELCEDAP